MKILGIDVGTGGSRAVVIDEAGKVVASATVEHAPFSSPEIGWAEQDPQDWWNASSAAVREVLTSVSSSEIAAVGFSGQMHGSVLLDENDWVLRPALLWCDQRTAEQCRRITEKLDEEQIVNLVCNPAVTGFTLPKLLWVREREPEVWQKVRTVLLPKDYVRFCLTGEKAGDVTDASGTLVFDVQRRKWSSEMLAAFEISESLLPRIFESVEIAGTVSAEGAKATGLIKGTPVVAGAGDNAAGAVGMGVVEPGVVGVTIGTSGVVFVVTERPTLDHRARTHTLCHAIPQIWQMTGVTQSAGLSLRWLRDNTGCGASYNDLVSEAATVPAGANGLIWLPYLMGERTPHRDPDARAAFVGLTASHTRAHLVRAVLEGVAFSLRDSLEIFKELKVPIETVRLGGGGVRSALWSQIQADVYGQDVQTLAAEEGAAYGAALLAGVGAGAWQSVEEACRQTIKTARRFTPNPEMSAVLDRNYEKFRAIYPALRPVLHY